MIQQYTFDGSGRQIDALGVFFRYESGVDGSGVTDITLFIDGVNVGTFAPGDALELPQAGRRWEIKPVSSGCVGVVKIGTARITTAKLAGIVQTVDASMQRAIVGQSFMASSGSLPGATEYPMVQLWNKSTDRHLVIKNIRAYSETAAVLRAYPRTLALATPGNAPVSKRIGGATSTAAETRGQNTNSLAAFFPLSGGYLIEQPLAANTIATVEAADPIVVPPSAGLVLMLRSVAANLYANFEWFEVPV